MATYPKENIVARWQTRGGPILMAKISESFAWFLFGTGIVLLMITMPAVMPLHLVLGYALLAAGLLACLYSIAVHFADGRN